MAHVVVTRPAGQQRELVDRLRARGYLVTHIPLVAIEPAGDEPIDVSGYDWVVLTSANGARELRRRMRGTPRHVAAIGRATAEAFGHADLVAERSTQEGLLEALHEPVGKVLFAAAEGARRLLPEALDADTVVLYRTVELSPATWPPSDLVLLASPSAARAYGRMHAAAPAVTIGPETSRAAREAGVTVVAEASTNDVDGLVAATEHALAAS
jgi:uroporphyrinogen III methyltransferase / synthase